MLNPPAGELSPAERARLDRRALLLAYTTVGYNLLEAAVALSAGTLASSAALIAFGGDSLIEVTSALVIIWQYRSRAPRQREERALRVIAICFFALAAYVTIDAVRELLGVREAHPSPVGIALAAVSLLVMPTLFWAKRRTGTALGSTTVLADATQTLLCAYLSAALLIGLLANATLGWGWADSLVALIIAAVATHEGWEAWHGEHTPLPTAAGGSPAAGDN
ncbi:MAG: cation diffusion facilitator family transporter [Haloechinothrix sp.]